MCRVGPGDRDLYPDADSRARFAVGINDNPALVAIYGPIADVRSVGGLATFKLLLLGGLFLALLCGVLVRRHLRLEEESGRAELLSATVIGRDALPVAAVSEAALVALLTGALVAVGNVAAGLDAAGSVAFGLAWAGLGLVSAGVTALSCQLSSSTRTAGAIAAMALGGAYLVRAVGDVANSWLTWLSPFGWASHLHAYGNESWWVASLFFALFAVSIAAALALARRRDLGAGIVADRPGPASGSTASVWGLTLRQHGSGLVGWAVALLALGAALGGVAAGVRQLLGTQSSRDLLHRLGGSGGLVDTFLATEISFIAVLVAGFAVSVVVRAASGETEGRTEQVLATTAPRGHLLGAVSLVALSGPVLLLTAFGAGLSLSIGLQRGQVATTAGRLLPAVLAPLPAVWTVTAVAILCLGSEPRGRCSAGPSSPRACCSARSVSWWACPGG